MFLITENISKVKIHFFYYVFMFLCFITGNIRDYLIFTFIIIVHELGHIVGGLIFSWRVDKVIILPFGAVTIFNCFINTSLFQQFIVTLLGPLFQILFFLIIRNLFFLSDRVVFFNNILLIFNLLPIFPLDGSKFVYIFLCFILPFRCVVLFIIFVSFIFIFFVAIFFGKFDLMVFLILFFLSVRCFNEFKNRYIIFNKFLFERYSNDFKFRCIKVINSFDEMFLWCGHIFIDGDRFISEKKKLLKMFDKHYKL